MKKTAIALVVAGLAAASVAQAAPQENTFYAGVKAGQASFHDGVITVILSLMVYLVVTKS